MSEPTLEDSHRQVVRQILQQQAQHIDDLTVTVAALLIYVGRQPGFDRAQYETIQAACRMQLDQPVAGERPTLARLLATLLRDPGARQ